MQQNAKYFDYSAILTKILITSFLSVFSKKCLIFISDERRYTAYVKCSYHQNYLCINSLHYIAFREYKTILYKDGHGCGDVIENSRAHLIEYRFNLSMLGGNKKVTHT